MMYCTDGMRGELFVIFLSPKLLSFEQSTSSWTVEPW